MMFLLSLTAGALLDRCFGDPASIPHPVVFIGKLISAEEKYLRRKFPEDPEGEKKAGIILALTVPLLSFLVSSAVLLAAYRIHPALWFAVNTFWAFQIPASKCLADESRKVYNALVDESLTKARTQLSWLVGRETSGLSEEEVTKACVETVAENTSDGVTAPFFWMMAGGVPLGFLYKAVNTLDSMVGYRNEKYEYFGKASARLDDLMNFIPSRLCGIFMCISAYFCGLDGKNAFRIFKRDRKCHLSPNSAQTESAAAGALGIRLGGTHVYFGKEVVKPSIGDAVREAQPDDILKAGRLMYFTGTLSFAVFALLRIIILMVIRSIL